jgi:thioredoxin-dependent peroxiredoxin
MSTISVGDNAPNFWLPTDDDLSVTPIGIKGKSIILYFYPKADTPGCTNQAVAFSGLQKQFDAAGCLVIGVSKDKISSLKKFRQKHNLSIMLASDFENQVSEAFGVWVEKSMYGRTYMGLERATFLINPDGIITHIWRKVKVAGHGDEVLGVVQKMA